MGNRLEDGSETAVATLGSPPGVDPIAMERARARAEAKLFGTGAPPRIGRYEIVDTLGGGGMGVVYRANDPQLHRKVALKILHPLRDGDERSQQRMLVEARALAQLDHPNVVKVHDALLDDQRVILVMELLEGETLEQWQQSGKRSWREVVDVYAQAGEGLVAAHALGVVHRDFKPSNAIICADGRVCVVDFGLARLTQTAVDAQPSTGVVASPDLTTTGDVFGTLAYASPEQLAGKSVDAASDQFSFCVALHQAVEGVPPFDGTTYLARRTNIETERPRFAQDGRRVPAWLRTLVARGLAPEPRDRCPSMRHVVRELRRSRGWKRWRLPVLTIAVLSAAIASTAMISRGTAEEPCDGAPLADVWNSTVRSRISSAVRKIGTPYALDVELTLLDTIDAYSSDWRAAHQSACRAHRRGDISSLLLDKEMTCLSRRLGDLRAAVSVLERVDTASIDHVMDVASNMPRALPCLDLESLQNDAEPPASPNLQPLIAEARSRISVAEALERSGRSEQALATIESTRVLARTVPYAPLEIELGLAEGRLHITQGNVDRALPILRVARAKALEQRMLSTAVEASARLIYVEGTASPQLDRLRDELEMLLPLSKGLRGDGFARPLLLNSVGTVFLAAGQRLEAASYFEKAKAEIGRRSPRNPELQTIDSNLAFVTSDPSKREALLRGAWEELVNTLGEQHFFTLDALQAFALYTLDTRKSLAAMRRAETSYLRFHPTAIPQLGVARSKIAVLAAELGNADESAEAYRLAMKSLAFLTDSDMVALRQLCEGERLLLGGDEKGAIQALLPVYEGRIGSLSWWEKADALRAAADLGAAYLNRDPQKAASYLEVAQRGYPEILRISEATEFRIFAARVERTRRQMHRPAP